jgi:hypothetical protein
MKANWTQGEDLPSASLPDVPNYPDAPLLAWKHYGILKLAETSIHQELEQGNNVGLLVGLRVSYFVERPGYYQNDQGDEYTMSYGYGVTDEEWPVQAEPIEVNLGMLPSEEFLFGLSNFVTDLIANNINPYVLPVTTRMDITFSVSGVPGPIMNTIMCRIVQVGECALGSDHEGERRRMYRSSATGNWKCQHTRC